MTPPFDPKRSPQLLPYAKGSPIPADWVVINTPWRLPILLPQGSRIPIYLPSSSGGLLIWNLPSAEGIKAFYGVRDGLKRGIFTDWGLVAQLVIGIPSSCYQKFPTAHEAAAFTYGPEYMTKRPWFYYPGSRAGTGKSLILDRDLAYKDDLIPPSPRLEDLLMTRSSAIADEDAVHSDDLLNAAHAVPPAEHPYAPAPTSYAPEVEEVEEGPTLSHRTSYSAFITPSDTTTNAPSTTSDAFNMEVLSEAIVSSTCTPRRSIRIPVEFAGEAYVAEGIPDAVVDHLDALRMDEESVYTVVSLFIASRNIIGFKSRMLAAGVSEEESGSLWPFLKENFAK